MATAHGRTMKEIGHSKGKNYRAGKYVGDCKHCGMMLADFDKGKCRRCGKKQ